MNIERTPNGISNTHLFYSVDHVIYVEGKYDEQNDDIVSFDQYFWRKVAQISVPSTTFKVLSRGGKPELLPIAEKVINGLVSNTIVALDRDYDFECRKEVSHPKVIYTYGYSWENDCWCFDSLMNLVEEYHLGEEIPEGDLSDFISCLSNFEKQSKRVARLNLATALANRDYMVPTSCANGLVSVNKGRLPTFNVNFFQTKAAEATRPMLMSQRIAVDERHVLGHLLAFFGYHFVCSALAKLGQKATICADLLTTAAVNRFARSLESSEAKSTEHYRQSFSQAVAST